MAHVYPFQPVAYTRFAEGGGADVSDLVAPPYDVLDAEGKAALLKRSERNIVAVDLPHIPAKDLGPAEAYRGAAERLAEWLADGTLKRVERPSLFCYRETFTFNGRVHRRTGMACTVDLREFGAAPGGGILPHEETFSGPKADRTALMKATRMQLSPIFGLHQDERGQAAKLCAAVCAAHHPDATARTPDGTLHEVWEITDEPTIHAYQAALEGEDIFIADGHHRYNTQLGYVNGMKPVPGADHPSRRCMFVLVSMSDAGTVIGPTHRVLGGMSGYSWDAFRTAATGAGGVLKLEPVAGGLAALERAVHGAGHLGDPRVGVYDFKTGQAAVAAPARPDPLKDNFPGKPPAWRTLDVAFVQYVVVEGICQPRLNGGQPVQWAVPHSIREVEDIGAGRERGSGGGKSFVPQLAVIVRPTPLEAVREVSRAGELMPQKSTFFFPKIATGFFLNPLE